jgi:hypothetical protein
MPCLDTFSYRNIWKVKLITAEDQRGMVISSGNGETENYLMVHSQVDGPGKDHPQKAAHLQLAHLCIYIYKHIYSQVQNHTLNPPNSSCYL